MKKLLRPAETVVLLHGLARTTSSMRKMASALEKRGFRVINLSYPSRKSSVETLSDFVRHRVIRLAGEADRIHFVTHSLGGILVRRIQKHRPLAKIGRVVMLSPPNQGSEVVDRLGGLRVFRWVNGPAGLQLGTGRDSLILALGPVDFELGVITGDRSINLILSTMFPGKNDGKVSVARAQVEGMKDFLVVHATHPFIMKNKEVIDQVHEFLTRGKFR